MRATGSSLGASLPRIDAAAKVTGAARYAGDVDLPNQAWIKVVFAGVPHAEINAVDVEAACAAPGVIAVLTAADVPVNEYGLIMPDQPVLCGTGSTEQARTRWRRPRRHLCRDGALCELYRGLHGIRRFPARC